MRKTNYTIYMTSACPDNVTAILVAFNRNDQNEIDKDLWGCYIDRNGPSVSGMKIFHCDFPERTQSYSAAFPQLESAELQGIIPLDNAAKEMMDYAIPYIMDLKEKIESTDT